MMADRNTYLKYKRDQRLLVYWIARASNRIIKIIPSETHVTPNTTGEISLGTLKSLSELIARHINPIPTTIYRLFQSIIEARKETHRLFLRIVASNPDPDIQRNNESHKHWINGLTEAFNALGGDLWLSKTSAKPEVPEKDEEEMIFANTFSMLSLDGQVTVNIDEEEDDEEDEDEEDGEQGRVSASAKRSKKRSAKKGKKGRRERKPKTKTKASEPTSTPTEIPLESYRIIDDETGIVTDYLMAVYAFVQQWIELRHYLQGLWHEVAYDGLNTAVAATLSNVAIGMIKDTQSQIFVDFPGHDSFETVMKTITRGGPARMQGLFRLQMHRTEPGGHTKMAANAHLDVREEILIHCYQDLVDFIADYQKTRSGKPTKAMLKEIQHWNPALCLTDTSKEQRMKWRRAYTINWLYDLVNINSSIVVQRRTMKGQDIPLETVDWSVNGPWNIHRRLFGLTEFAGDITHFAVQKPGTEILSKILPHHVFQLQCIVDSMVVSRGWSINSFQGHVLSSPAPHSFYPRRDLDLFMDRKMEKADKPLAGFCNSVGMLIQAFDQSAMIHGDPHRHEQLKEMLRELRDDFVNWLGETKYMYGLTDIPASRFSNTDANGLWEYSPFLCGAGLMEALELAHGIGLLLWDNVPEPMCAIHLHNMLVHKGYISQPVGLYSSFEDIMVDSFFANGQPPTSNFEQGLQDRVGGPAVRGEVFARREAFRHRANRRQVARTAVDLHGLLDTSINRFFKAKSLGKVYRTAGWIPDRIPDEDIPVRSALGMMRLAETKQVIDPATGQLAPEDTNLVIRARAAGMTDSKIMGISKTFSSFTAITEDPKILEQIKATVPEGYSWGWGNTTHNDNPSKRDLGTTQYLDTLKIDLLNDICGEDMPLLSVNYVGVLARFMFLFMQIEAALRKSRNPLWIQAYEGNSILTREKRLSLTALALAVEDKECLQIMAHAFENPRAGFMNYIYWDDLEDPQKTLSQSRVDSNSVRSDACAIM